VTREHLGLEMLGETGAGTSEKLMATTVEAERTFRAGAFLSHPNIFAVFLACLLPLVIGLFLVAARKRTRLLLLVTISTGTAALVGTLSRSGWISFAVALAVLLTLMLFHRRLRQRVRLAAGLFAGVLMVVGVIFWEPISKRIFESKEHAVRSRLEHIGTASRMIVTRPLEGFGLNSYAPAALSFTKEGPRAALDKYQGPKEYPGLWLPPVHNIYLLWWAEIGLLGLVLHLVVLGQVIRAGLSNLRVESDELFVVNAACVAGIAALMVDGLASFSLRINSILRVFWVLAALIMAVRYWRLGQEPARPEVPAGSDARG
jgi:O-antigen ligase